MVDERISKPGEWNIKPPAELRQSALTVRWTASELDHVLEVAHEKRMRASTMVREMVLNALRKGVINQ